LKIQDKSTADGIPFSGDSSALLRSTLVRLPVGVSVYRYRKGKVELLISNPAVCRLLGWDEDALRRHSAEKCFEYVHPDDRDTLTKTFRALEQGAAQSSCAFRVRTAGRAAYIWLLLNAQCEAEADGTLLFYCVFTNITDRMQAQARVASAESKMRIALEHCGLAVWECLFAQKRNVYTPETIARFSLPSTTENVPQSLVDSGRVHPSSTKKLCDIYQSVMDGAPHAEGEIAFVESDSIRWFNLRMSTLYEDGKPISAICTAEDITREKELILQMEDEMMRRTSYESTLRGKGYYDLTEDRVLEYASGPKQDDSLKNLRTYTEALSATSALVPDIDERRALREKLAAAHLLTLFAHGTTRLSTHYRRTTPDGIVSWMNTDVHLARQPSTGHVVAFLFTTDINTQHISQEILDAIATTGYDAILWVNAADGNYQVFAHTADCPLLLPPSGTDFWKDFHAALKPLLAPQEYKQLTQGGQLTQESIHRALEVRDAVEWTCRLNEHGIAACKKVRFCYLERENHILMMTCTDITQAMADEQRQKTMLENALLAAQQASSAKSDFLSRMSHEIRTPLNAILGMSTLAAQANGNLEEIEDCISKIGISGHYLLSLINDILDMSRIESGKMLLQPSPFNLAEFVGGINSVIYGQAKAKGIDYETEISHGLDDGYIGDAMHLQQVLINLLGNAVKFTSAGGKVTFSLSSVSRDEKNARLRFAVNDTGCGIREDALERIFSPFEQQDSSTTSRYGGTGLGLAISKSLVELMGGSIRVRSIVDVGSEFVVEVPLKIDPALTHTHPHEYSFRNLHTLVVDDDLLVCEQTAATLRDIGMIPEWVTSGREAIDKVSALWGKQQKYDFILVDWKMPDMDGIETCRRIVGPDVTIIIITAYDWASIEAEAKAAGVNLCVTKPMFKSTLVSAFAKATGEAAEHRENTEPEYDFTGRRILIAEDHPLNAEIARRLLEKKGCTIEVAENGLCALQRFTATPAGYFNAILMDVRMPMMDGLQAAHSIRFWNKADAKTIPIIAMTANAFDEDVQKSKAAGMDAHLAKPIDPALMFRVLYRLMK
jgi:PAS domain S-box-containing protein